MKIITFIDTEVSEESYKILDIGAIKSSGERMHEGNVDVLLQFVEKTDYLCGHNVLHFDMKYLRQTKLGDKYTSMQLEKITIDTLYLSPLLFPQRPYHALVKDDKLQADELNNPLNDAIKAKDLFYDEVEAFIALPELVRRIFYALLYGKVEFAAFFNYLEYQPIVTDLEAEIKDLYHDLICNNVDLKSIIERNPIELAYCLSLIYENNEYSITPPWILKRYPVVDMLLHRLRGTPCITGCKYCNEALDARNGLKRFFGYDAYRDFDGVPLQEQAVEAAIHNKSLLAVFPTGGGKSITFQVPALMAGKNTNGLTVVISPLQSLMKDQVDNLERGSITDAVTINGLLDPIERAESIRRVREGEATILYISPESLRSKTVEKLLVGRKVVRFVIDEAHCFSAWGQDFRVDYMYIADFVKKLCNDKNLDEIIPISCFTATAKQNVIDDIKAYFKDKLGLELDLYTSSSSRKNLHYQVIGKNEHEKYDAIRSLLSYKECPTIIYVSRTKRATDLVGALLKDGYQARAYHGKMDKKEKSENQDAFIRGEVDIMVATSAFGMGVDKKNVGMVIHYDISDSLENYVQEAGRAGRDQSIEAECFVLFNEEDLNKHFLLLNQTKISMPEIQQIWRAIKDATRRRSRMTSSALEIAREAGWDDNVREIETRVKTAIAALEDAGYIKRGQNMPRVYADSIMAKSVMEANEKVRESHQFSQKEEDQATRILGMLISSRSRKQSPEEVAEARVDYMADALGMDKKQVIHIIQKLRQSKILADAKDLTVYMDDNGAMNKALNILQNYRKLEEFLLEQLPEEQTVLNIKVLNELALEQGLKKVNPDQIKTILNYWVIKEYIGREISRYSKNLVKIQLKQSKDVLQERMRKRFEVSELNLRYLEDRNDDNDFVVQFSVLELVKSFNFEMQLLQETTTTDEVEESLYYLTKIGALKLEGGFLVSYNGLSIERLERDNKIRYKLEDYKKLKQYYEQKTKMIHIVGEYAKKLMENYQSALTFVEDYFQLEYSSFLRKYFKGSRDDEIKRNVTPSKFRELFGELSPAQLQIINDKQSQYIVVGAGPGSGKTRILVHKLASLLLMEDVKHEQLLMLTFSRAAATEFKKRLLKLIGNAANFVEIKTFHSFCFDLLGKVGNIEKSTNIIEEAARHIQNGEVEASRVAKTVLVIDEAQDMDEHEYHLIQALINKNEEMRVIAVGDDDQNIFTFRGSDSKYMQELLKNQNACLYELIENYRSKANLVEFTNVFVQSIRGRLKQTPIMSVQGESGQIKVIQYTSNQLITPVVESLLKAEIYGSTCILTNTNEEALQIMALLCKEGILTRLIQSNETYDLYNLCELRYFVQELNLAEDTFLIREEVWDRAKQQLHRNYKKSNNLAMCEQLISDFETTNNKYKYVSDWFAYLHESKEEDFCNDSQGAIFIGTIHKSKGWEFDHVVIMLRDIAIQKEEVKRQLYVGMTRAKKSLTIHCNGDYFSEDRNIGYSMIKQMEYIKDTHQYQKVDIIRMQLGYKQVFLSYYYQCQKLMSEIISGEELVVDEQGCLNKSGQRITVFSAKFKEMISQNRDRGYRIASARVNHVFFWNEEGKEEVRVLFPEVEFVKERIGGEGEVGRGVLDL